MSARVEAPAPYASRRTPRRGLRTAVLGLGGLAFLALMALDTFVVRIGSDADARVQAFSPEAHRVAEFPRIRG